MKMGLVLLFLLLFWWQPMLLLWLLWQILTRRVGGRASNRVGLLIRLELLLRLRAPPSPIEALGRLLGLGLLIGKTR
jgi:hypothetical protein